MNRFLKEEYDISNTIPAVFLDNFPDWEDPTEKEMTNKELQTLKDLTSAMEPFSCQDAEVIYETEIKSSTVFLCDFSPVCNGLHKSTLVTSSQ